MKPQVSEGNANEGAHGSNKHQKYAYQKAQDGRNADIRGLYIRNGAYIARITAPNPKTGIERPQWVPLRDEQDQPIRALGQARKALDALRTKRNEGDLPKLGKTKTLSEFLPDYLDSRETLAKAGEIRQSTVSKDKALLARWVKEFGQLRLTAFRSHHIVQFRTKLLKQGLNPRTVNLAVMAFRGLMNSAKLSNLVKSLPMQGIKDLTEQPKIRSLLPVAKLKSLIEAATRSASGMKNGRQFSDYVLLMAYTGARRNEALRLKWSDVDFERGQIAIGSDGLSKNHEKRTVDFHPKLEAHLREMLNRKAPDSDWMFPSPQRGNKDIPAKSLNESLKIARKAAGLEHFTFHDCRHFFISHAVMSGIDYMTIAKWVGHNDGGILIGKVYAHLNDSHAKAQGQRLRFAGASNA